MGRLSYADKPTGIVAFSDLIALGAVAHCNAMGLHYMDECRCLSPPLTSVSVAKARIAALAVDNLLERIKQPELLLERIFIESKLVVRQSTGKPRL